MKVINPDGMLLSFNPNGLKVMEIDNEHDVIGKDWLAFWKGNIERKANEAFAKAKSGKLAHFKGYCPTFKGTMKYWEVSIAPLYDDFGVMNWLLVTSRDVTKQKDLEKEVKNLRAENSALKRRLVAETKLSNVTA